MSEWQGSMDERVAETANRLRMIQVDFADQGDDVRQDYLSDEIERALGQVVPEQREAFLRALLERFPSWDEQVSVGLQPAAAPTRSTRDEKDLADPNFLVARLVKVAESLSAQDRAVLTERLRQGGLVPAGGGAEWSAECQESLHKTLKMPSSEEIDPARGAALVSMLAEMACSLDQLAWSTWQRVAPRSDSRRPGDLRATIRRYLGNSGEVGSEQVEDLLRRLRQLVAALISAVSQAGRQFASRHLMRFSPSEIEHLVSMEKGGLFTSKEVRCWQKYQELADALNEAQIENDIMETVAGYAESLMRGLGRNG